MSTVDEKPIAGKDVNHTAMGAFLQCLREAEGDNLLQEGALFYDNDASRCGHNRESQSSC